MPAKKGYKPILANVSTTALKASTIYKTQGIDTTTWGLALLMGQALDPSNLSLPSAAVVIWTAGISTTATSIGNAYLITFTDSNGRYGVTLPISTGYRIKVYGATS